jgi:hypothetical protein
MLLFDNGAGGGGGGTPTIVFVGPVSRPFPFTGRLPEAHGTYQDVLKVSTVRGRFTFSNAYTSGGEPFSTAIQRPIVYVVPARRAGGYGIVWTDNKVQAYNLDGAGELTTEVAAGTDLSAVIVPMIAYVIAH